MTFTPRRLPNLMDVAVELPGRLDAPVMVGTMADRDGHAQVFVFMADDERAWTLRLDERDAEVLASMLDSVGPAGLDALVHGLMQAWSAIRPRAAA